MNIYQCKVLLSDDPGDSVIITVKEDELLLPQLEDNNVPINYDCREGICGACESYLIKGKVITQTGQEIEGGSEIKFKPCISYPQSDLEIQLID